MSTGLVLEGGGMRGAYTGGFLETMLSENIVFPYVIGVSAGALTAISYISKQPKRNYLTFAEYATTSQYASIANLARTGSLFNFDYMFGDLAKKDLPLDYKTFFENEQRLVIAVTNLETGCAEYYEKNDIKDDDELLILRATASLPLVSRPVCYDGKIFMDGGCSSPLPIERSIEDGNDFNVIVMTRAKGYRKKPASNYHMLKVFYKDYPNFVETLLKQYEIYNRQVELCEKLESEGKALIIRPAEPPAVGRYEKDARKLIALLAQGSRDAGEKLIEIKQALSRS